jgi:GTP cyclohydrolase I
MQNEEEAIPPVWKEATDLATLLHGLGEDLNREGLQDTPRRFVKAWQELLEGYTMVPEDLLKTSFEAEGEGLQICKHIHFVSICEHHMLPFAGYCHVGYIPNKRVIGLSKLPRLVDCFARRLQIQERMVQQVCDTLRDVLEPKGIFVMAEAKHFCCHGRGVKRDRMTFMTTAKYGDIDMQEFQMLLQNSNNSND